MTALLLGFSLCVFIAFEIYKMAKSIIHYNEVRLLLSESLPLPDFFSKFSAIQKRNATKLLQRGTTSAAICLVVCAISAAAALAILFYNFLAALIGWCHWP